VVVREAGPGCVRKRAAKDGGGMLSRWRERSVEQRPRDCKPPIGLCCWGVLSAAPEALPSGPIGTRLWDRLSRLQDPDRCRFVSLQCTARGASNAVKVGRRSQAGITVFYL